MKKIETFEFQTALIQPIRTQNIEMIIVFPERLSSCKTEVENQTPLSIINEEKTKGIGWNS